MNRNDKANYIVVDDLEDKNITTEKQEELKRNFLKFIECSFLDFESRTVSFYFNRLKTTNMKKKIYIAGKVTGENRAECTAKFQKAQEIIEFLGFESINPIQVVGDWNTPWDEAMKKCITALMECDAIVLLPDWVDSKGAKLENDIANSFDMPNFNYTKFGLEVLKKNLCSS